MRGGTSAWEPVGRTVVGGVPLGAYAPAGPPGRRPAMAMLHGLEDGWQSWQPLAERFGDRFRTYAIDLPWHAGGSYAWRARATAAQWVDHALALVPDEVSVLVAHSMSANSVLHWLVSDTARKVDAIVLLSPFYHVRSAPVDWAMFDQSLDQFRTVMKDGLRMRLGDRADRLGPDLVGLMDQKMLERVGPRGFLALFDTFISSSGMDLSSNNVPTLVVGGSGDAGINGPRAEELARDLGAADVRIEDGLTHFCHAEQPDRVAELISGHLLRVPALSPAA
ncbi:alpha/beta hydrolase [Streptomyces sp. HD1123-B1]|uniref:alpha/beta fold hydrolase n=1 Tax=Streptomyces huangiella TaxID=3228804 RepID=UPI003D7D5B19